MWAVSAVGWAAIAFATHVPAASYTSIGCGIMALIWAHIPEMYDGD